MTDTNKSEASDALDSMNLDLSLSIVPFQSDNTNCDNEEIQPKLEELYRDIEMIKIKRQVIRNNDLNKAVFHKVQNEHGTVNSICALHVYELIEKHILPSLPTDHKVYILTG